MQISKKIIFFCTLCIILIASVVYGNQEVIECRKNWPFALKILTGVSGGQWDSLGNSIAEILSRSVRPTFARLGGAIANIENINSGKGDIAFSMSCFLRAKELNENIYMDLSSDNTVLLARLYPQVLYILVRKEFADKNGIDDLEDLLKKRIPIRFASLKKKTGSHYIFSMLLKYGYDTSFEKLKAQGWQTNFNNYSEIADKFVNGELDCFAYTAGSEVPFILSMEKFVDIKIMPIPMPILKNLHDTFRTDIFTLKPGLYKSVIHSVNTLSDYACLVVRKDLPENLVYEINKSIWENRKYLSGVVNDFKAICPGTALYDDLEAHKGSLKFWDELIKLK